MLLICDLLWRGATQSSPASCKVEAICTNKLKNKFESLVNVETCSAAKPPTEACKPVPSPPSAVAAMLSPPSLEDVEEARAEERR